jgi:SLAP domain-containing protein
MQKLIYEDAWERTISEKDRNIIENSFKDVIFQDNAIQFTQVRWDVNYKKELLLIVLIHNCTNRNFSFMRKKLHYTVNGTVLAEHTFTFSNLIVEAHTSMPWTFIFPYGTYQANIPPEKGKLEMVETFGE